VKETVLVSWSDEIPVPEAPQSATGPEATAAASVADLGALDSLDSRPLAEHADVYQQIHSELQSALAEIDGN
jgi:hypothetical protein